MVKFRKPKKLIPKKIEEWANPEKTEKKIEPPPQVEDTFFNHLSQNENKLRAIYENCSDVIFRSFFIGRTEKAILIYIEGLSNIEEIDNSVLSPLMDSKENPVSNINNLIQKK